MRRRCRFPNARTHPYESSRFLVADRERAILGPRQDDDDANELGLVGAHPGDDLVVLLQASSRRGRPRPLTDSDLSQLVQNTFFLPFSLTNMDGSKARWVV